MIEIKNAYIVSAKMSIERDVLTIWLVLDYDEGTQGFGGFVLYLPKSFKHHTLNSCAGHFIWKVMEIAGVEEWSKLAGKTIRVKAEHEGVSEIGHIIKDIWFNPSKELKE